MMAVPQRCPRLLPWPFSRLATLYRGWWIVLTGILTLMITVGSSNYILSVITVPMEVDLGWSRSLLYGAVSIGAIVSSIVSGMVGPLFDRYGARVMMAGSSLVIGVSLILVAAVTEAWEYYALMGFVMAAARAFSQLGPRTAIANWFIRRRPSAYATYTIGGPLSGVVLVSPVAWVLTFASWRWVWIALGVFTLAVVLPLGWWAIRRRPEEVGLLPDGDPAPPGGSAPRWTGAAPGGASSHRTAPQHLVLEVERPEDRWTRTAALRTSTFWLVAIGFMLTQFAGTGLTIHLAPYGLDKGLSTAGAAGVLTAYSVGAVLARILWAHVVRRLGIRRSMTAFALSYVVTIMAVVLSGSPFTTYATSFAVGLSAGATLPLQGQVWPDYFGRNIVGALSGYSTLIQIPAQAFAPFGAALARDLAGGYAPVFSAFAFLSLIAGFCFMLAPQPGAPAVVSEGPRGG